MRIMLTDIIIILVLIILNGAFTGAELAILSVNKIKIKQKAEEGHQKAILVKKVTEDDTFLPSIAIAYTIMGMLIATYSTIAFAGPISDFILSFGDLYYTMSDTTLETLIVIIITTGTSYATIVLAETIPKKLALIYSEKISYAVIKPLVTFSRVIKPVAIIFSGSASIVTKLLRIKSVQEDEIVTEEDILMLVDASDENEEAGIDADEKEMIKNIFEFNDKIAEEIVTHRTDIVALSIDSSYDEIVMIMQEDHSRIPIYDGDLDNIQGVVHIKDLMKHILSSVDKKIDLRSIMREPYYVPISKKINDLFSEMKKANVYFSIVIDEYGGVFGILTMEDLIEEVMGSILDEYDTEEMPEVEEKEDGSYVVSGIANIEHVNERLGLNLPTEEYDTLGGFVVGKIGKVPTEGDELEVEYGGMVFKIQGVSEKRIQTLLVYKKKEEGEDGEEQID